MEDEYKFLHALYLMVPISMTLSDREPYIVSRSQYNILKANISRIYLNLQRPSRESQRLRVMCLSRVKNIKNMTSQLLMLVILAVLMRSSQALRCYACTMCDHDQPIGVCETGSVCVTILYAEGGLSISKHVSSFLYAIILAEFSASAVSSLRGSAGLPTQIFHPQPNQFSFIQDCPN